MKPPPPLSHLELEDLCTLLLHRQEADALVLAVVVDGRFELVSLTAQDRALDVPKLLRTAADEYESGGGIPLGNHLGIAPDEGHAPRARRRS